MSVGMGVLRECQLPTRPAPSPPTRNRRRQRAADWRAQSSNVEHFFCQHATAEEGDPPVPPPAAAQKPQEQQWAASTSARQLASTPPPVLQDVDTRHNGPCICPPEGDAQRPVEYWEYDETLWLNSSLEKISTRGVARRDSLTSDEPSEPPCAPSSFASPWKQRDSTIATWSNYEQDYSARRECLALTECVVPCP